MAKYSKKLADKIVALIEEDNYTISDVCKMLNISRNSFYTWKAEKEEFARAIDKAIEIREERFCLQARKILRKKLDIYTQVETKTIYVPSKENPEELVLKEHIVKEKQQLPDTSSISYILSRKTESNKNLPERDLSQTPLVLVVKDEDTQREVMQLTQNVNVKTAEKM